MNKHRCILPLLAALLLTSQTTLPVRAEMCSLDQAPGATLLLPHFEVDYLDIAGLTTFYRLINVSPEPTLLHVTYWTQWGYPTIDFDIYLTGYDVVAANLRDDILNGNLPITGDHQSDPLDRNSPHGSYPELDASFANCENFFPFYVNPLVRGNALERLQDGHTGKPLSFAPFFQRCIGPDHGDTIARGFITFDVSSVCHTAFPNEVGYFVDGGLGFATNNNRVYGDWQIYDPARGTAYGGPMVSIEADPTFNSTSTPTGYTFWGIHTFGSGADNREPLGAVWDFRLTAGATSLDPLSATDILVWRDSTSLSVTNNGYLCGNGPGSGPNWAPLSQASLVCWDEEENPIELCAGSGEDCFPLMSQRVALDQGLMAVPFSRGFCRLDTNAPNDSPTGDVDFPPGGGPTVQQSFVSVVRFGATGVGAAQPATPVRHACDAPLP